MPSKQKKLVFVTRPISPPWDEGSKNLALDLSKKIRINKLSISLLTTGFVLKSVPKDVAQIPLYSNSKLNFFNKAKLFLFLIRARFDIFHLIFVTTPITSLFVRLILILKRVRSVQTVASLDKNLPNFFLRLMLYGNRIVCFSKSTADKIKSTGISNVEIIPPGVDVDKFKPGNKKNKIAFLGELYRMDSFPIVSELVPLLVSELPNYSIVLGFRGSTKPPQERESINKLHKKYSNIKNVDWKDVIGEMEEFLKDTKLVIIPAKKTQGKFDFPMVLLEALSCGTPIIISPINPLLELTRYKGAFAPSINTPNSFANKIREILSEASYNSFSKQARETAVNNFSIEKVAKQYEKIYEELTKN